MLNIKRVVVGEKTFNKRSLYVFMMLLLMVVQVVFLARQLTSTPNISDARQNLQTAYNLATLGIFSQSSSLPLVPDNYREPLPIFILAAHLRLDPRLSSNLSFSQLNSGSNAVMIKQHNLIWCFVLLCGILFICRNAYQEPGRWIPLFVMSATLVHTFYLSRPGVIDRMMTEIQAATIVVWACLSLTRALQNPRYRYFVLTGVLLGCLALTKAIVFYVAIGIVLAIGLCYGVQGTFSGRGRSILLILAMILSFAGVTLPWAARNYIALDSFGITQRGGAVLLIRAYKNRMTPEELRGSFYVWGPNRRKMEKWFGYSPDDLEIDGPLRRLNRKHSSFSERDLKAEHLGRPDKAVSFYRAARAERVRLKNEFSKGRQKGAGQLADNALRQQAIQMIRDDWIGHLRTTPSFLWRGVWSFSSMHLSSDIVIAINIVAVICLCVAAFLALSYRDPILFGCSLLPAMTIGLLAFTTHFIPRYSSMCIPIMIIVMNLILGKYLLFPITRKLIDILQLTFRRCQKQYRT